MGYGHLPTDQFYFIRSFRITWQKYFKNLFHVSSPKTGTSPKWFWIFDSILENIFECLLWTIEFVSIDTFASLHREKISKINRPKQIPTPITISVLYSRSDFSVLRSEYKFRRNMKIEWATCPKSSVFVKCRQWYDSNCSQL